MTRQHLVSLAVPGAPVPMERARRGRHGNWYTPPKSIEYRERIQAAWQHGGRPDFREQPVTVCAYVYIPRPPTHLKRDGEIRARYQDAIPPGDTDNYAKAIADALNGLAYKDDTQITCWAAIAKQWASRPGSEHRDPALEPSCDHALPARRSPLSLPGRRPVPLRGLRRHEGDVVLALRDRNG